MKHCNLQFHDIDRELWRNVTKGDLILYYNKVAPYILPDKKIAVANNSFLEAILQQ